ncbi:DNA ligase 1 [Cloeon dipterum]|uniref:DNA ligase 1 n=1 Tax=Cloeon dipterum TaxID=197152 RepID=UPI0032208C9F
MSQRSITSFFSVQKKKVEEEKNDTETTKVDNEPKSKQRTKSPLSTTPVKKGKKSACVDDGSPIGKKRKQTKKLVLSSDEDDYENITPKSSKSGGSEESSGNSASSSSEEEAVKVLSTGRKKRVKGATALKELEAKRAAKRARVDNGPAPEKPAKKEENSEEKVKEECSEVAEEKGESSEVSVGKAGASEVAVEKEEAMEVEEPEMKNEAVEDKKGESKETAAVDPDDSETKEVLETSDFSDTEKETVDINPPSKKTNAKKPAAKGKKGKSAAKKKSPVAEKKKNTAPVVAPAKKTMSNFFGRKEESKDSPSDDNKSTLVKPSGSSNSAEYNPLASKYHPIDNASWQKGKPVPYLALARTLEAIENTSARLKITEILSNFYRSVIVMSPENLIQCVYLCLNKLAPAFEGLELGLAEKSLMKAVSQSSGRSDKQVLEELDSTGDLGIVAQNSCGRQTKLFKPPPLNVPKVFSQLKEIAAMKGRDSMTRKLEKVSAMYNACQPIEARYLLRSLSGKLRIGLAEQTVLQALALACVTTPPEQKEYPPAVLNASQGISAESFKSKLDEHALILKTTYCECPVYEKIIPIMLEHGLKKLPEKCQISPGIPLRPMLAQPTKGVADVLARFDGRKFTCEFKYDGERAQVHISDKGKTVRIFSRNQEDNTSKYPDLVSRIGSQIESYVEDCILDCEAVAWDRESEKILPFQVLSTRKKKDANESEIKIQVCLFVFDLLYINGEPLVRSPLNERRNKLKEIIKEVPGQLKLADGLDTDSLEEVQAYLELSIKGNCEGLMVKTLEEEATYEIAKRSRNWLKLKKDYLDGVGDTLDLVVLGGYLGRGKRTGVYGGFLLGCYDPEAEEYQSICKIGTGFSDEDLHKHSEFFKEHILSGGARPYYRYDPSLEPDHWFDAVQVWEVKCADLSLSPIHKAAIGIVDPEKGISLRFPRFLRIRDDKKVEEATAASQVAEFYQNQEQVKNQADNNKPMNEEDFY